MGDEYEIEDWTQQEDELYTNLEPSKLEAPEIYTNLSTPDNKRNSSGASQENDQLYIDLEPSVDVELYTTVESERKVNSSSSNLLQKDRVVEVQKDTGKVNTEKERSKGPDETTEEESSDKPSAVCNNKTVIAATLLNLGILALVVAVVIIASIALALSITSSDTSDLESCTANVVEASCTIPEDADECFTEAVPYQRPGEALLDVQCIRSGQDQSLPLVTTVDVVNNTVACSCYLTSLGNATRTSTVTCSLSATRCTSNS